MSRIKVLIVSLLALCVVGSAVASTASAELQGPWFKQVKAGKQIKIALNAEQPLKSENEGAFTLKSSIAGSATTIKCSSAISKGNIWNGLHQGEDNATVEFTGCTLSKALTCIGDAVEVEPSKVYSELQWKYAGKTSELTEVGQQKIYDVFAPTEPPKNGKQIFTKVNINKAVCETLAGEYPVEAVGSLAKFTDQTNTTHEIVWGTAALVEPQNEDVTQGHLTWTTRNVTELHHQGIQTKAKLELGTNAAELEGKLKIELNGGEAFGAFNE